MGVGARSCRRLTGGDPSGLEVSGGFGDRVLSQREVFARGESGKMKDACLSMLSGATVIHLKSSDTGLQRV